MGLEGDLTAIGVFQMMYATQVAMAAQSVRNLPVAFASAGDDAAGLARAAQGTTKYPGVDEWANLRLREGTIVYGGAPGQSAFYTTAQSVDEYGASTDLFRALQVAPDEVLGYRPGITAYRVTQDIDAAASTALANPQWGAGGAEQLFISNFDEVLEPVLSVPVR